MQKLKDEMSDLRAALREQLNLAADRIGTVEHFVNMKWGDSGRRIHDLEIAVKELKAKRPKKVTRPARRTSTTNR